MYSAFGVDHGEVSKAFPPLAKLSRLKLKGKPKVGLKSSGETENPFTSKPSKYGEFGSVTSMQNAAIRNRQPGSAFSKPSGASTTKKKPTYQTGGFGAGGGSRYNSVPTRDSRYH